MRTVWKIFLFIIPFLVLTSLTALFLQQNLDSAKIHSLVSSFGIFAPIIFVVLTASTNIIPPLGVIPFWIAGVILFGPSSGFLLAYLANILGSSLNFLIARTLGRKVLSKFDNGEILKEINKLPHVTNPKSVFILKLVGGALVDYISYAAGFSKIGYLPYLISSAVAIVPMMILGFMIISSFSLNNILSTTASMGVFYFINYASSILLIPVSLFILRKKKLFG